MRLDTIKGAYESLLMKPSCSRRPQCFGVTTKSSSSTAYEYDWLVARGLEVLHYHDAYQVTYVQRVGRRVDADVCRCHLFGELLFGAGHHVVYHAAPTELFYEIFLHRQYVFYLSIDLVMRMAQKSGPHMAQNSLSWPALLIISL